jgi:hypothetical protein
MPEAIPVFDDPDAITITDDDSDPGEQRFVTLGNLMRLFLQQIEAMQELKGKAPQVAQDSVDQVHDHQGGQAVVGSVNTSHEGGKPQ